MVDVCTGRSGPRSVVTSFELIAFNFPSAATFHLNPILDTNRARLARARCIDVFIVGTVKTVRKQDCPQFGSRQCRDFVRIKGSGVDTSVIDQAVEVEVAAVWVRTNSHTICGVGNRFCEIGFGEQLAVDVQSLNVVRPVQRI